jgi:hypothetical protein
VINVLAGVNVVQRTGKSRVRLLPTLPPDGHAPGDARDPVEREREIDHLLTVVDSELAELTSSEIFKRCAWLDAQDAETCTPDTSVSLFALRGPASMSIVIREDETDSDNQIIVCAVQDARDGCIQLDQIRSAV